MLLDEAEAPMDFSRGSERLNDYNPRRLEMEGVEEHQSGEQKHISEPRGLDLSVLDRLSQKAIRSGLTKIALLPSTPHLSTESKT